MKKSEFTGLTSGMKETKKIRKTPLAINIILSLGLLTLVFVGICKIVEAVVSSHNQSEEKTFPKIELFLAEAPIEQINIGDKGTKYTGNTIKISVDGESKTYDNVEIKGRGNSTWVRPKRPYQIKFENEESPFGFNKSKKWILLANYLDPTLLRADTAFYLEQLLDITSSPKGAFAELYIDNTYYGVYYLVEKIEIGKSRINLNDTFGSIVELDNIHNNPAECHYTKNNDCIVLKDTVNDDNSETNLKNFVTKLNTVQQVIRQKNYDKLNKLIDVDSFIKYYLLNEFSVNPDAYTTSFFMYQDGENDKIHAGPGWDLDLAFGNENWSESEINISPYSNMVFTDIAENRSSLLFDLLDIPEFEARVKEIFRETMSGKKEELLNHIKSQAEYIRPAALRDQERWKFKTNFDEEVGYLLDWVSKRYDHFEETYGEN